MADLAKRMASLSTGQRKIPKMRLKSKGLSLSKNFPEMKDTSDVSIQPMPGNQEYYPLSPSRKQIYILNQTEGVNASYNLTGATIIEGEIETKRLERVFRALIQRHEILRTSFHVVEGEIQQKNHQEVDFSVSYFLAVEAKAGEMITDFIRPFDLSFAPLLRVGLIRLNKTKHVLIYDMHQIISDGISQGTLMREFIDLYESRQLPVSRNQYKDYTVWQSELYKARPD